VPAPLTFWFEFASTYSYPAAHRIEALAAAAGVEAIWRPFLLGPLLNAQQGMTDSPFNVVPVKGNYMWRDMARVCGDLNLPLRHPTRFPRNGHLAARIVLADKTPGWAAAFTKAVYSANFADDLEISDQAVLTGLITGLGADPATLLAAASSDAVKAELKANTAEAAERGLFGSPSFTAQDHELFWGNDRLDAAIHWAANLKAL
jgi:2-hydroxychromene-2-carboxylate isomerase